MDVMLQEIDVESAKVMMSELESLEKDIYRA